MSPVGKQFAPMCCPENIAHGFVLALSTHGRGETVYADEWCATLVDAMGVTHPVKTKHCPVCGTLLYGMPHVTLEAWSNVIARSQQDQIDEAVRKVREAQRAVEAAAEWEKKS